MMRGISLRAVISLACLWAPVVLADDDASVPDTKNLGDSQFQFAEELLRAGEYYRAQTEYLRMISYRSFPDSIPFCELRVSECYAYGNRWRSLNDWTRHLLRAKPNHPYRDRLAMLNSEGKLRDERYAEGAADLDLLATATRVAWIQEKALFLSGIARLYTEDWSAAEERFRRVGGTSELTLIAQEYADLSVRGHDLPHKSPTRARVLSIVPGLGYTYTGHHQTAGACVLAIALSLWGTVELFESDNEGWGVLSGMFCATWYGGSIYGAGKSAERFNRFHRQAFLMRFEW